MIKIIIIKWKIYWDGYKIKIYKILINAHNNNN